MKDPRSMRSHPEPRQRRWFLRLLPLVVWGAALAATPACESGAGGGTGTASFPGFPGDPSMRLAQASPAEVTGVCDSLVGALDDATDLETRCLLAAILRGESESAAQCQDSIDACVADNAARWDCPFDGFPVEEPCDATIGELDTCYGDSFGPQIAFVRSLTCSTTQADLMRLQPSAAACDRIESRCPAVGFKLTLGAAPPPTTRGEPPTVSLVGSEAVLVRAPQRSELLAYLCDDILGPPANASCGPAFGAPPPKEDLQFQFRLDLRIENPNGDEITVQELLVGLHLYPDQPFGEPGALCAAMCDATDDACPIPETGACAPVPDEGDGAAALLAAGTAGPLRLAVDAMDGALPGPAGRLVPANAAVDLTITIALGVDPLLQVLGAAADDWLSAAIQGDTAPIDIPYAVAGRLWFDVPRGGRLSVGFGPHGDEREPLHWTLP